MKTNDFTYLLNNPREIKSEQITELKNIVDKYPYFQSARALYLKGLKDQESFKYNNELKVVAAYTTDRSILFNFISSKVFNLPSNQISQPKDDVEKKSEIPQKTDEELKLGKPLTFTSDESHSFGEWLQLSVQKPIDRKAGTTEKDLIVDKFVQKNHKIPPIDKNSDLVTSHSEKPQPIELMTETLAKVYLEQNKFKEAIKAYQILSLKYPEKSGFFADQIKNIQASRQQG